MYQSVARLIERPGLCSDNIQQQDVDKALKCAVDQGDWPLVSWLCKETPFSPGKSVREEALQVLKDSNQEFFNRFPKKNRKKVYQKSEENNPAMPLAVVQDLCESKNEADIPEVDSIIYVFFETYGVNYYHYTKKLMEYGRWDSKTAIFLVKNNVLAKEICTYRDNKALRENEVDDLLVNAVQEKHYAQLNVLCEATNPPSQTGIDAAVTEALQQRPVPWNTLNYFFDLKDKLNYRPNQALVNTALLSAVTEMRWHFVLKYCNDDVPQSTLLKMVESALKVKLINWDIITHLISFGAWNETTPTDVEAIVIMLTGFSKSAQAESLIVTLCQKPNAPTQKFVEDLCYNYMHFIKIMCQTATNLPCKTLLLNRLVTNWLENWDPEFSRSTFNLTNSLITLLSDPLDQCEENLIDKLLLYAVTTKNLALIKELCAAKPSQEGINSAVKSAVERYFFDGLKYFCEFQKLSQETIDESFILAAFEDIDHAAFKGTPWADYFLNENSRCPSQNAIDTLLLKGAERLEGKGLIFRRQMLGKKSQGGFVIGRLLNLPEDKKPSKAVFNKAKETAQAPNIQLILSMTDDDLSQDKIDDAFKSAALNGYLDVAMFLINPNDYGNPSQDAINDALKIAVNHPHPDMIKMLCESEQCSPSVPIVIEMIHELFTKKYDSLYEEYPKFFSYFPYTKYRSVRLRVLELLNIVLDRFVPEDQSQDEMDISEVTLDWRLAEFFITSNYYKCRLNQNSIDQILKYAVEEENADIVNKLCQSFAPSTKALKAMREVFYGGKPPENYFYCWYEGEPEPRHSIILNVESLLKQRLEEEQREVIADKKENDEINITVNDVNEKENISEKKNVISRQDFIDIHEDYIDKEEEKKDESEVSEKDNILENESVIRSHDSIESHEENVDKKEDKKDENEVGEEDNILENEAVIRSHDSIESHEEIIDTKADKEDVSRALKESIDNELIPHTRKYLIHLYREIDREISKKTLKTYSSHQLLALSIDEKEASQDLKNKFNCMQHLLCTLNDKGDSSATKIEKFSNQLLGDAKTLMKHRHVAKNYLRDVGIVLIIIGTGILPGLGIMAGLAIYRLIKEQPPFWKSTGSFFVDKAHKAAAKTASDDEVKVQSNRSGR